MSKWAFFVRLLYHFLRKLNNNSIKLNQKQSAYEKIMNLNDASRMASNFIQLKKHELLSKIS